MKCPKCGYNSFDYLDSCKKCGKDLVEFKQRFGIKSVLLPGATAVVATDLAQDSDEASELAAATALGAADVSAAAKAAEPADDIASGDDFGFDFMGESSEEEDLSFDELFEEAPQEDDMEESLDAPKTGSGTEAADSEKNDFAFDVPEADEDLEDDFGFGEDVDAPDAELKKPKGSAEGPSDPFDFPESSPVVEAPVTTIPASASTTADAAVASSGGEQRWTDNQGTIEEELSPESAAAETSFDAFDVDPDRPRSGSEEAAVEADNEAAMPAVLSASLGGRFASFVYDAVILLVIGLGFVVAAELSMSRETGPLPTMDTLIDLSVPYFLVLFSLTFGYFTLFHFLAGQTPGKMLTSLQVETSDGDPLTFSQAFLRSVGGLLQLLPFGLGYLQILFSGDGRGWNDRLAGTRVVKVTPKK